MLHQQLKNHIEGSILKEQYLEAFLVQSAYIESLLKLYVNYVFWDEFSKDQDDTPMKKCLSKKLKKFNLYNAIEFLSDSEIINDEIKTNLHTYRQKRNDTLHELLQQIDNQEFDQHLKDICHLGENIINSTKLNEMSHFLIKIKKEGHKFHFFK